ncbi:nitroreductase family deazaflavin-dependent oxidoreductase [Nocardia puris]|uniref:Deazaflavin-dependent oxidoreductase (Nitroreductase family) n=1 Tax=Nocardia puris TaxID=208602 RepID=A0A366D0W5_9NOCA|nr:nitroreductase/quinone reductase family protein [Nocardia puris]MBF6215174.1 nitroreductase family deazaflavin-dependent oxidoreductase [Nocardia puris]MBF6369685.1 nitroreductase family deazaflavin-dependent oxidoreductase [Nocardia puris]MBF6462497.1 nitroreductase family deazaflavin-dependent oxidoreductase [Nocardia puris]RBO83586.1 deazaflavin-dependent oxidoreductase (nitroreductase family) [Nocardia puris]
MSENDSTVGQPDQADITEYNDPNAPWNQAWEGDSIVGWNDDVIKEFRENSGKVGGAYAGGDLILLTTTGAKSGKRHTTPLGPLYRGDIMYVSSFIEDKYPAWWYNIKANPQVTVELRDKTYGATGKVLEGADYDEFAAWVLANNPLLADFQSKVDRPLPLVVLTLDGEG